MSEAQSLTQELASFPPSSATARVLGVIGGVIPGTPPLPAYTTVDEAAAAAFGGVPDDVVARARELVADPRVDQARFAARAIDTGDTGLTIVSGVRSAIALFTGDKEGRHSALAQQQRTDAAVKAFGLAYVATRLLPVPPAERLAIVTSVPAGQQLLAYFGAIEVALPFGPEVQAANGTFVADLVKAQGRELAAKVLAVVGRDGAADAQEMLGHLVGALDRAALAAAPHTAALADKIRALLPGASWTGDLSSLVASGADALPAYRYLVARLAVEASLALAKHEAMPDVPLPTPPPAGPVSAPPPPPPPVPQGLRTLPTPDPPIAEDAAPPPPEPDAAPPPTDPEPWPTSPLPEAERLRGFYLGEDGWRIWTVEGVFTDRPWADAGAPDWDAHRAGGATVARYRRAGERVTVTPPGGEPRSAVVTRDDRSILLDGVRFARTDWDLKGRTMEGRWDGPGGPLVLRGDGAIALGTRAGTYTLGVGTISVTWEDGSASRWTLLSDLRPASARPAELWLAGARFARIDAP